MARHVVIGTAGHIDHGKTTLVRALTGVDTDRLAEEKSRGITIDLGFAPLDLGDRPASVVDVPGHEGFIRNMVAGATGVDVALLVVAADEGVMPQTREHLAILRFLGVRRGVVALTKCDLAADEEWRALVTDDVKALVGGAMGAPWPVVEVAAATGGGLDALRSALADAASGAAERTEGDRFRMPVDRVFSLPGAGTIVTGTVWSGTVAEADTVTVLPAGITARVRSVQVHGASAAHAGPGRRAALALVGLPRAKAERGSVVVTGDGWRVSRALDVSVTMLDGEVLTLRRRVRVHHGTAEVMARVARLAGEGPLVRARLLLEDPLVCRAGDRLVLRAYSPVVTIGGAEVLDPWVDDARGARLARRRPLAEVAPDDRVRVRDLVTRRGPDGMTRPGLEVAAALGVTRLTAILKHPSNIGLARQGDWFVARAEVAPVSEQLLAALRAYHEAHPLERGMPLMAWRGTAGGLRPELLDLAEAALASAGQVVRDESVARLADWVPGAGELAAAERERLRARLRAAGAEPPSVAELEAELPGLDVAGTLRYLAREGEVVAVARDRYYDIGVVRGEVSRLHEALAEVGPASPADLRIRLGLTRKFLIPFLEWTDREGYTRREGDRRMMGRSWVLDSGERSP